MLVLEKIFRWTKDILVYDRIQIILYQLISHDHDKNLVFMTLITDMN